MITAVTMLGEAFRQWQKDWDSYDKGISDKPKSYDEFIIPFIEKEKEQIIEAHKIGWEDCQEYIKTIGQTTRKGKKYYNQTYNLKKEEQLSLLAKEAQELNLGYEEFELGGEG